MKKDILWRVYLGFIIMALVGFVILGKAFYIQQVQGSYWRSMSDSLHQKIVELDAERGTIFSEDGSMLSTSIPQFDIYIDFMADGLREKNGKRFRENVDSLSICLAHLFNDEAPAVYKKLLQQGYREKDRYFLLRKKVSFKDYQKLRSFPLVRLGKNRSGFIADTKTIRLNPYKLLASRTIGLLRDSNKVGLELTYNHYLSGVTGKRSVRYISGGATIPMDGLDIEPQNGKDIVTTLDVNIQDITENALMKMMEANEAEHGCAIVMEVKTGKIKAIANLGHDKAGKYLEDYNYAITPSEPGSTFKLATMLSVLEDKKTKLHTLIDLEGGEWKIYGQTVYDSEQHGLGRVTVKQAFEHSSNVGMAKLAWMYYNSQPGLFLSHLSKLHLDTLTGIDIKGEIKPRIYRPGSRSWSKTTLPWMGFGYNLMVSPLQVLTLYNAVANNGVMMKPYLVNEVKEDGATIKDFKPVIVNAEICSKETLKQLQACLEGVITNGTGRALQNTNYTIAGKTGTALVANGRRGYIDHIYQSSFAGYFPADNPQYSIIVVIKNKPHAVKFYGAQVAGPVFKEIADQLFTLRIAAGNNSRQYAAMQKVDSVSYNYGGYTKDMRQVTGRLQMAPANNEAPGNWGRMVKQPSGNVMIATTIKTREMPVLSGMGLKDVVYLCENLGLKVNIKGMGKVMGQSIEPGRRISPGQTIMIQLN